MEDGTLNPYIRMYFVVCKDQVLTKLVQLYVVSQGGLGYAPQGNVQVFRLYKVVSGAILDHSRLIYTLIDK